MMFLVYIVQVFRTLVSSHRQHIFVHPSVFCHGDHCLVSIEFRRFFPILYDRVLRNLKKVLGELFMRVEYYFYLFQSNLYEKRLPSNKRPVLFHCNVTQGYILDPYNDDTHTSFLISE